MSVSDHALSPTARAVERNKCSISIISVAAWGGAQTDIHFGRRVGRSADRNSFRAPRGEGDFLTGVDFWASPCVLSPILAIRTPRLPLLLQGEKGAGGMRGKGARERRTSLISPKNSPLESTPPQESHTRDGWSAYYIVTPDVCDTTCNEKFAPNKPLFTHPVSRSPVSAPPL